MADFFVIAPDATPVVGGVGDDRLVFTLASGPGGTNMTGLTVNASGGYDGVFDIFGPNDTSFTGIENFSFTDKVGGQDIITTGGGNDRLYGGVGNDIFRGGGGSNDLFGNAGRDRLFGGDDFDRLNGGKGNDTLYGNGGGDQLYGGLGDDRIYGGLGDDFIDGGLGNNLIKGGAGSDFIISGPGDDRIFAGADDDFIEISETGARTIDGGDGRDSIFAFFDGLAANAGVLTYNMKTGAHGLDGSTANQSVITDVEDYAVMANIDVKLVGNAKNNVLSTDKGDDILYGNRGRDTLFGGDGDDLLVGNQGNDRLNGSHGDDTLRGGLGADTFEFTGGLDVIRDFADDVDTIEIYTYFIAPGATVQDVINDHATVVGGNTVLTFDTGNVLTIDGLTDTSQLLDDVVLHWV